MIDDALVGYVGEVHELVAKNYEINTKVYILQLDIKTIIEKSDLVCKYKEISKFPKSERDLSMTVPKEITVDKIEKIFKENGGKLLENYELFDIYEGEQVAEGYKSIAYNLSFRANDHSLVDGEVDEIIKIIVNDLSSMGIELRK